ncbi:MAG: hypothetical protein K2X27_20050 [Candidatus Obscuribacterales bacterium]|nr:hypothetical protein [Candidatus Obscuribacterales bacterium]
MHLRKDRLRLWIGCFCAVFFCRTAGALESAEDPANSTASKIELETATQNNSSLSGLPTDESRTEPGELSRLKELEEKFFSRVYSSDSSSDRILRLEKFVFGAETRGEANARIDKLYKVFIKTRSSEDLPAGASQKAISDKPRGLLSVINDGIDNYNRHRFHNAEDDFNDALYLAPGMSRIHVYLGVTLLQLNQRRSAIDAMRAAYELDPFGNYGRYAKHCLITLMGDEEVRKRGPKDNLKTVQKTLSLVNSSANKDAARQQNFVGSIVAAKQSSAYSFANSLNRDGFSNEMALKQSYVRTDAMTQVARARQDAALRSTYTYESANNLKSLLTAKLLPGDAKLRAFGTTLHARYYGDETYNLAPTYIPREAPFELKASAASIKSAKISRASGKSVKNSRAAAGKQPSNKKLLSKKTGTSLRGRTSVPAADQRRVRK